MSAATMVSHEPAVIVPDGSDNGILQHSYATKRKNSLALQSPSSRDISTSQHYFANAKHHHLYNRSSSHGDTPQSLPTPPLPPSEEYPAFHQASSPLHPSLPPSISKNFFATSAFKDHDLHSDLSTRHIESTWNSNPLQNLMNYLRPYHFSLSENLKFTLTCCMWYVSSSLTNNTGKQILNVFKYPVTLTFIQFGLVAIMCFAVATLFKVTEIRQPTHRIVKTMVPLACFLIVGHVFSSVAISRVPVSLVHTIKALAPLFTVLFYRFIFRVSYSMNVYISLLPLTMGVILACTFTFSNNLIGLLCAFLSCLVFVTQNIFSKKLLFKEQNLGKGDPNKLDKMNMLFYSSFLSFLLMSPLWLYSDGARLLDHANSSSSEIGTGKLIYYFVLNGTTNFGQNWFAFTTLSMTSPVTYSIASLVKRIFVIVMSILWFGQQVKFAQSLGILLTFVGLWMYQSAKRDVDRGESKVREKSLDVLPTSGGTAAPAQTSDSHWSSVTSRIPLRSWIPGRWSTMVEDNKIQ